MLVLYRFLHTTAVTDGAGRLGICLFALENYLTVRYMHVNRRRMALKQARVVLGAAWAVCLCLGYFPLGFLQTPAVPSCFFLNGLVREEFLMIYQTMFFLQVMTLYRLEFYRRSLVNTGGADSVWVQSWIKREKTIAFIVSLVWLAVMVSSGPIYIALAVNLWCPGHCGLDRTVTKAPATFPISKSTLVVLIFLVRLGEFRQWCRTSFAACAGRGRQWPSNRYP